MSAQDFVIVLSTIWKDIKVDFLDVAELHNVIYEKY